MVEPALGLLGARRGDLACGEEGNENREDEEAGAENSLAPGPRCAEFGKDLLDEPERVPPADLAMSPKSSAAEEVVTHQPMTLARCIRMASPVGPKSSRRWGGACTRSGDDALPGVTPAGEGRRRQWQARR